MNETIGVLAVCGEPGDGKMHVRLGALMTSGLWDNIHPDDRAAWCERGEVLDTTSGETLFRWLSRLYGREVEPALSGRRAAIARKKAATTKPKR